MPESNQQQQQNVPRSKVFIFWLILIVIIILITLGIYYVLTQEQRMQALRTGQLTGSQSSPSLPAATTSAVSVDPARLLAERGNRPTWGDPAAGLVIVEFADFECSICQEEFYQIREFINRHQKEVYFIYRHYPVKGNNSLYLAEASMCAYEQDKFWPLHDKLFLNQGQIESEAAVTELARQSGLELGRFEQCLKEDKYQNLILTDMTDAVNLNVQGTPTFFINGSKLEGAIGLADWEKILEKYKEISK